ncbi:MAG: hypothetical protein DELT_01222 [Desulfovibrio sp.]
MNRRFFLTAGPVLCLADFTAIFLSCGTAFLLRYVTSGSMSVAPYIATLPWLLVFPLLFAALGLYPATFMRRPEELKRQCIATTVGFMGLAFLSFLIKESHSYSRLALLLAWVFAVCAVPFARWAVRRYCRKFPWWNTPCVLLGSPGNMASLAMEIVNAKHQGITPAVIVLEEGADFPAGLCPETLGKNIVIERISLKDEAAAKKALTAIATRYRAPYAVVRFSIPGNGKRQTWLNLIDHVFQRIIIIPDIAVGGRVWVMAVSIGSLSGILLRQNLLDPNRMLLKRGIDLLFTFTGGLFLFPAMLALAIAVRIDSPGAAIFSRQRIGRNGKHFNVYKFRTMAVNGDAILKRHLEENPEARHEWAETQKLKDDPRVTRMGKFLRKTSLDELPQLLNVLKGEMSVVGPRPIVDSEVEKYGDDYALYTRVRPGITGLWQVSGRNDVSYEERVRFDHYYVCNWSVWLDILIIARTVPEVLHCSGAY